MLKSLRHFRVIMPHISDSRAPNAEKAKKADAENGEPRGFADSAAGAFESLARGELMKGLVLFVAVIFSINKRCATRLYYVREFIIFHLLWDQGSDEL